MVDSATFLKMVKEDEEQTFVLLAIHKYYTEKIQETYSTSNYKLATGVLYFTFGHIGLQFGTQPSAVNG